MMPVVCGVSRFSVRLRGIHQTCYRTQTFAQSRDKESASGSRRRMRWWFFDTKNRWQLYHARFDRRESPVLYRDLESQYFYFTDMAGGAVAGDVPVVLLVKSGTIRTHFPPVRREL